MNSKSSYVLASPRPLPVLLLADVSGSMDQDGKIQTLNRALREMIATFADEEDRRAEIQLGVITFGGTEAVLHQPLQKATELSWSDMEARGATPMGAAFDLARAILEDREKVSRRSYRPTLILVSDGQPTDDWEAPLEALLGSERASKATRFAMAIGEDADEGMLRRFLGSEDFRVFRADDAATIEKFFRYVTLSVSLRSRSANPNQAPSIELSDLDEFEF